MSPLYESIAQKVDSLSPSEQLQLISRLTERVGVQVRSSTPTSILELQGLGKEIWGEMDAQAYVDHERASWNG